MKRGFTKDAYYRTKAISQLQLTIDSKTPLVRLDGHGRLHSLDLPAVEWEDGLKCWFIHGVQFPPQIWERVVNRTIPAEEAVKLSNIEMRRIAIERLGIDKVLAELHAVPIDKWREYELYQISLPNDKVLVDMRWRWTVKQQKYFGRFAKHYLTAQYLRMVDPSTNQTYFVRVPPPSRDVQQYGINDIQGVDNCRQAVAWTFHMSPEQYTDLLVET